MKRIITICALTLTAAIAASSLAVAGEKPPKPESAKDAAAKQCAAAKKADKAAFKSLYGKHAMRTCIKGEPPESATEFKNAAKECKAARSDDATAFAEAWGDKKNALGKCVSATVKADDTTV